MWIMLLFKYVWNCWEMDILIVLMCYNSTCQRSLRIKLVRWWLLTIILHYSHIILIIIIYIIILIIIVMIYTRYTIYTARYPITTSTTSAYNPYQNGWTNNIYLIVSNYCNVLYCWISLCCWRYGFNYITIIIIIIVKMGICWLEAVNVSLFY